MKADSLPSEVTVDAQAPAAAGRSRLLAIASAGHSGSTLLDLLIGNHSLVSSAGEMNRLTLYPYDRVCACGSTVTDCDHWKAVLEALREQQDAPARGWSDFATDVIPQRPLVELTGCAGVALVEGEPLPDSIAERFRAAGLRISTRAVLSRSGSRDRKWSLAEGDQKNSVKYVLRPEGDRLGVYGSTVTWKDPLRLLPDPLESMLALGSRTGVRALAALSARFGAQVQIARNSWSIMDAIAAVTGSRYVIDSSKSPVRLKLLYMLQPDRVRIAHLVRDGRAVVASTLKRRRTTVEAASRVWKRDNRHVSMMLRTIPRALQHQVRYEAVCENPERELRALCAFLGLEFEPAMLELWQRPVHNIPGNPMLFQRERRTISRDDRWKRVLSHDDLRTFERVAGAMNRSFGYGD
jgi:hypothetical protein